MPTLRPSVLRKTLRDLAWQVFWYGVGLALIAALDTYIFPSYHSQLADLELPDALRALIGESDYGTANGFLSAEFFSWAPVLLVVFAIMAGTSALAGEEAAGTLDLLLSQPISRVRLALEKMAGFAVAALAAVVIVYAGWLISVPFVAIDVSLGRLLVATLCLLPLILFFGALALFCAALLPDRRTATGVVTAVAVVSYFLYFLTNLVDAIRPLRFVSAFYYGDTTRILDNGPDAVRFGVLVVLTIVLALLAVACFGARDIGVRNGLSLPRLRPRTA